MTFYPLFWGVRLLSQLIFWKIYQTLHFLVTNGTMKEGWSREERGRGMKREEGERRAKEVRRD